MLILGLSKASRKILDMPNDTFFLLKRFVKGLVQEVVKKTYKHHCFSTLLTVRACGCQYNPTNTYGPGSPTDSSAHSGGVKRKKEASDEGGALESGGGGDSAAGQSELQLHLQSFIL